MSAVVLQRVFHGPNPFAVEPVVVVLLDPPAGGWPAWAPAAERLRALSADWWVAPGAEPVAGLSVQLGRFVVDWSLQALNFRRGCVRAGGCQPMPSSDQLLMWMGFHEVPVTLAVLRLALSWLGQLQEGPAAEQRLSADLEVLWRACHRGHPDYQARIVMEAARALDIPCYPAWGQARHWQYGQGARGRVLFESGPVDDGWLGGRVSASKAASKQALLALGLPTPPYVLVQEASELPAAVAKVGWPCVSKPLELGGGKGVSAGHLSPADLAAGFWRARRVSPGPVMVEAQVAGEDHRLMVVDGCLRAAIRREPSSVVGDGLQTVGALVQALNASRDARSLVASAYRRPVLLDEAAVQCLALQGVTLQTVLPLGQVVRLRSTANLSTGGVCTDVSDRVHPQVRVMAETLACTLGLQTMGADYLTTDIGRAPMDVGGAFIEFNLTPGLDALIVAGWSSAEAGQLALGARVGRIPLDMLVVADEAVDAVVSELQAAVDLRTGGWASSRRAVLGLLPLEVRGLHPWAGVNTLLSHRGLTDALVVCGWSAVERHGLPVDRVDGLYLGGVSPSEAWLRVMQGMSRDRVVCENAMEALAAYRRDLARQALEPKGPGDP